MHTSKYAGFGRECSVFGAGLGWAVVDAGRGPWEQTDVIAMTLCAMNLRAGGLGWTLTFSMRRKFVHNIPLQNSL